MYLNFKKGALGLAIGLALSSTAPVIAADAATDDDTDVVIVVGSRAAPRSVGDSSVPVDVISGEEFDKNNSGDMVSMLSSVVPSFNVNTQPISDAATLIRPANLRGLPPDSTLVLVNGKRRHRAAVISFLGGGLSDGAQGPDISVFPSLALKQVEILRDGAAAQYGSDAIAGVINFVLKDDADGTTFEAKYGETYKGDGATQTYGVNTGFALTDRGFANITFEWKDADATSRSVQRSDAAALISAGNLAVANPAQIWGSPNVNDDFKLWLNTGLDIGNNKEVYMFGNWAERTVDGGFFFRNPNTRGGIFGGPSVPDVDANGNPILDSNGDPVLVGSILTGDLTPGATSNAACPIVRIHNNVPDANAFAALPGANCFAFNSLFPGGFTPRFGGTVADTSIVFGTKGEFENGISYDLSAYVGQNQVNFQIRNTVNGSLGPNTPTSFDPGGYTQREKAANADFVKLIDTSWSITPVSVAFGVEYREDVFIIKNGDAASFEVGPLAAQGFGIGSNGFPGFKPADAGTFTRHNNSGYVDIEANPTDALTLGAAIRYEDFSDFGDTTNGKFTFRLQASDSFALRGSYSTGFHAPTIGQSNVRNVTTAFNATGGLEDQATLPPTNPIAAQKGAVPLKPEDAKSFTFGGVFELDNFFFTLDYYNIKVTDRISQTGTIPLTAADIAALEAIGISDASSFKSIKYFTNNFDTRTQGVDLVANWSQEMFGGNTKYALAYNYNKTKVSNVRQPIIDGNPIVVTDGTKIKQIEDNLPKNRATFTISHTQDDWNTFIRVNYYGSYFEAHLDAGSLPINAGAEFTVDAEFAYNATDELRLIVGAQNLFNNYPDKNPWADIVGAKYPTTSPMGFNGGFWYVKASYSY